MRQPEGEVAKVAVIWGKPGYRSPSRYSQLRRWVSAGQAMLLWSTWLSNPDILEVPDVVLIYSPEAVWCDSHI